MNAKDLILAIDLGKYKKMVCLLPHGQGSNVLPAGP
jgi:hypothetical protein